MGTRCLTRVFEDGKEILCMYRQFDGYPDGHGDELAKFLAPITVVNGIGGTNKNIANGMGCLAAQLVASFKTEPGGFYIMAPGTKDVGEQYTYHVVKFPNDQIGMKVESGSKDIYFGRAKDFDGRKVQKEQDEDEPEVEETIASLRKKAAALGYKLTVKT